MKNNIKLIFLLFFALLFGCKIQKQSNAAKKLTYDLIKTNTIDFSYYYARAIMSIKTSSNDYSANGRITIYKDSLIKVSAYSNFGLPIFNAYINPKNFIIKSLIFGNNQLDYDSLQTLIGLDLKYKMLQNALVDNIFTYPDSVSLSKYQLIKNDTAFILSYKFKKPHSVYTLLRNDIHFKNYRINKILIWDFTKQNAELYITYSNFKTINNLNIPTKINLTYINFDTLKVKITVNKLIIK